MTKDKKIWIVNRNNPYNSEDAKQYQYDKIRDSDGMTLIEHETHLALDKFNKYMIEKHGIELYLVSAYRSEELQQNVWDEYRKTHTEEETNDIVAPPGASEHHTGRAVDIHPHFARPRLIRAVASRLPLPERVAFPKQPTKEEKDKMYELIHQEAAQFGFILRYPKGKKPFTGFNSERWHFTFMGDPELAQEIEDSGMCLEEYVEYLEQQEQQETAPAEELYEEMTLAEDNKLEETSGPKPYEDSEEGEGETPPAPAEVEERVQ